MSNRINVAAWMESTSRWRIQVQKNGERRSFYSSTPGRTGQRECHKKADAWLDNEIVDPSTKVNTLFEEWLESLKSRGGTAYYKQYKSYWDARIQNKIGKIKMSNLNEQHLQSIIDIAYKEGLAKKTLINLRACLRAFCKYARKRKLSTLFPESLDIPKNAPVKEKVILQPSALNKLLKCTTSTFAGKIVHEPMVYAWRLQVFTGLRPGELIGLKWSDIDLVKRKITIGRSINSLNEKTSGKNENAIRNFMMTDEAYNAIIEYIAECKEFSEYVFPNASGESMTQTEMRNRWYRYKAHAGITATTTPYELRHTFVSIFKNLPEGLIKPIVGHSVNMDTYATYGHELDGDMELTATLMQKRLKEVIDMGKSPEK